jgi:hypothetical protein
MVEEAVAGRAVINTWTTNSHTLTTADGTTSEARCAMLEFTDTGAALTGAATVVCPSASKLYVCKNDSGQQVTIQTAAGTGVAIPDGQTMFVFCDGTNVEQCETNFNSLSYNGYTLNFGGAVTTAGAFTTSGAYALTLTTTGATNVTLPTTGTLATLDGTETLTNKTLTAPTISSPSLTGSISATDLTISGNTTIGDASADTLTVNSTITSNLIFTDDTYDIGATGATRPRNLFLSGNATIGGTVTLSGGIDVTGALGVDGNFDVNTDKFTVASATGNTVVAGTLGVTGATTATGGLNVDTIDEITASGGVTIDGVLLKDNAIEASGASTFTGQVNFDYSSSGAAIEIHNSTGTGGYSGIEFDQEDGNDGLYVGLEVNDGTSTSGARYNSTAGKHTFYDDSTAQFYLNGSEAEMYNNFRVKQTAASTAAVLSLFTDTTGSTAGSDGVDLSVDGANSNFNLIQREDADMILYTNGAEKIRINNGDDIMLGGGTIPSGHTATWDSNIWVAASGGTDPGLIAHDSANAFIWNVNAYYDGTVPEWKRVNTGYSSGFYVSNGKFHIRAAGTAAADSSISYNTNFVMQSGGQVNIGPDANTHTPATNDFLTIVNNDNSGTGFVIQNTNAGSNAYAQLEFVSDTSSGSAYIFKNSTTKASTGRAEALVIYNESAGDINFWTGASPSERLTIDGTDGFVGIGSTTPSFKLTVNTTETSTSTWTTSATNVLAITTTDNNVTQGTDRFGLIFSSDVSGTQRTLGGIKAVQEYTGNYDSSLSFGTRGPGTLDTVVAAEKMRLRNNGHLLLHGGDYGSDGLGGNTGGSDSYLFHMVGNDTRCDLQMTSGTTMGTGASDGVQFGIQSAGAYMWNFEASSNYFGVNNVRIVTMRETNMLVRSGSATVISDGLADGTLDVYAGSAKNAIKTETTTAAYINYAAKGNTSGGNFYYYAYMQNASDAAVGNISCNSSSTTYNTTSDRRLKENINAIEDGTSKIMAMKPVTHTWIAEPDKPAVHGFIAQEMQEVVPEAVHGEDGGEEMMSMDYGRITPVIVAALQEANRKIAELETRIKELEAN